MTTSSTVDAETRAALLEDTDMQAISMQRGENAITACIAYVFLRYSYTIDAAAATSLLTYVRRHRSVATRAEALRKFQQAESRSKAESELGLCISRARDLIITLKLAKIPTADAVSKYKHLCGSLHDYCSHLPTFESIKQAWVNTDLMDSDACIRTLELAIKAFDTALRETRRASAAQIEALKNSRYQGDAYALSEADALEALRSIANSALTPVP